MNVLMSINKNFRDVFTGNLSEGNYASSIRLINAFQKAGHNVSLVHPTDIHWDGAVPYFSESLTYKNNSIKVSEKPIYDANLFFIRSLGEDSPNKDDSKNFMDSLYSFEKNMLVLNDAESTSYEVKSKQKELPLPFIRSFDVKSTNDISDLLSSVELIAKPEVGFQRQGIMYLNSPEQANQFSPEMISRYCFEEFMPEQKETRYLFLEGNLLLTRVVELQGLPGKETQKNKYPKKSFNEAEYAVAKQAIDLTGMFYGSVDFRQGRILEINGSGSGTSKLRSNGRNPYDLIVSAAENKYLSQ